MINRGLLHDWLSDILIPNSGFYIENHFVWLAKYGFKVWFNIIKYKYVKEFHFGIIFLAKKFVLSMIICIFAALVPAEPLYNA